jgi:hypothetical protein
MHAFLFVIAGLFVLWFGVFLLVQLGAAHTAALVYVTVVGFGFVAAALYALRSSHRLVFGLIEVIFGMVILAIAANSYYAAEAKEFIPIVGGGLFRRPPEGLLHIRSTSVSWFQMAAAIYVLVRGFDNVGVGLRRSENPKWNRRWRRVFPDPYDSA